MNEEIKALRKKNKISYDDIGNYLGYSGGYIKYLLGHELTEEKRALILDAINELSKEWSLKYHVKEQYKPNR